MKKITTYFIVALLFLGYGASAQLLKRGDKLFNAFSYEKAITVYEQVWKRDSSNFEVARKLATAYRMTNNMPRAEKWYGRLVRSENAKNSDFFYYIQALESNEKYAEAKEWLNKYRAATGHNTREISLDYIKQLKQDSVCYIIEPVNINSTESDFGVVYTGDSTVVFCSSRKRVRAVKRISNRTEQNFYHLYEAKLTPAGDLKEPRPFNRKLESVYHNGSVCYSPDKTEMFITRSYIKGKKGRVKKNKTDVVTLKLYYSRKDGDKWTKPQKMAINLEEYSSGHPAISADGRQLFFVSDRPGGFGGTDIYVVNRLDKYDAWGEPVNVGPKINTSENEMFPFLDSDGTLYFSSKGYSGLGGLDVYRYSPKQGVVNMGYPINSSKDDFSFVKRGKRGFFASNRLKGKTYDDIYKFTINGMFLWGEVFDEHTKLLLPYSTVYLYNAQGRLVNKMKTGKNAQFSFLIKDIDDYTIKSNIIGYNESVIVLKARDLEEKVEHYVPVYQNSSIFLDGIVLFKHNLKPLEGVSINISLDGEPITSKATNKDGHFYGKLLRNKDYTFSYYFGKYRFVRKSVTVSTRNIQGDTLYVQEMLERLKIEDIYYDLDKSNIRPDAAEVLDQLVMIMRENPAMRVELSSYTDSRASDTYNMALSERRAKSAVRYIVERGISPDRITAKGHGETQLVNHCGNGIKCTEEEHQANRRTEIKILDL